MMKRYSFFLMFFFMLSGLSGYTQVAPLDPAFGAGKGYVHTSVFTNKPSQGNALAVQPDGKILVCGVTGTPTGAEQAFLFRFTPDGTPDPEFNGSGRILLDISNIFSDSRAVKVQADGKIVLAAVGEDTSEMKVHLFRFFPDGSPDNSFDQDGQVITSLGAKYLNIKTMAIQPDGKILLGGYAGFGANLFDQFLVLRYNTNGSPDKSFDGDGYVLTTVGEAYTNIATLILQPDGKIIAAGHAEFNGDARMAIVRYNSNGSLDHSFSGDGMATVSFGVGQCSIYGAAQAPDGKIIVGGYADNSVTGYSDFAVAKLKTDGTLDESFHGDGKVTITVPDAYASGRSLLVQPDGKIVIGGYINSSLGQGVAMALLRLKENGIPDPTFDGDGLFIFPQGADTTSIIHAMAFQPDGKIMATGIFRINPLNTVAVARIITGLTTSTTEAENVLTGISLCPNPVVRTMQVQYELVSSETISIYVMDMQGRIVDQLMTATPKKAGSHVEELYLHHDLIPGAYLLTLQAGRDTQSMKIIVN